MPRTTLQNHPEMAQNVGLVIAEYATLELLLFYIYALLTKDNVRELYYEFFSTYSLNKRCELINCAAKKSSLPQHLVSPLNSLIRRFKSAAKRRTEIAHVMYLENVGMTRIRLVRHRCLSESIDRSLFDRTFKQFYNLGTDLVVFLGIVQISPGEITQIASQLPFPARNIQYSEPKPFLTEIEIKDSLIRLKLAHVEQK